jgi:hypothetical protein
MEHYDIPEVEADIENLCMEFETNKEYLVNNWELEQEKKK